MKIRQIEAKLYGIPTSMELIFFDKIDAIAWKKMFDAWLQLKNDLRSFNAREPNLPEGISEVAYCILSGSARKISVSNSSDAGSSSSFDTYNLKNQRAEQVKACSVASDLTSFGPDSKWDDLIFMDFYNDGNVDGTFSVYLIPSDLIYNSMVNKISSFQDFQKEGKRPRLHIKESLIRKVDIKPIAQNVRLWENL
jgi:hypothetical protein